MLGREEARGKQEQVQGKKKAGISLPGKVGGKQRLGEGVERESACGGGKCRLGRTGEVPAAGAWGEGGLGQAEVLLAAGWVNLVPGTGRGSQEGKEGFWNWGQRLWLES